MTNYLGNKKSGGQDDYTNLIKSVYENSITSDDKTVSELVEEIKIHLLKIMK